MTSAALFFLTVFTWIVCSRGDPTCNVTSRLDRGTAAYLAQGHYFDYDRRLPCTGAITAWNFCYYMADQFPFLNFQWMRFQIWRDIGRQTLEHVYTHHIRLSVGALDSTERFQCFRDLVDNPTEVKAGDFIGLLSAFAQLVPVIGQGVPGSILYIDDGDSSSFLLRPLQGLALHVDVEIEPLASSNTTSIYLPPKTSLTMPYTTLAPSTSLPTLTPSSTYIQTSLVVETSVYVSSPQPSPTQLHPSSEALSHTHSEVVLTRISSAVSLRSSSYTTSPPPTTSLAPSPTIAPPESAKPRTTVLTNEISVTPSSEVLDETTFSGRDRSQYSDNWSFVAGLVVGAVLLVLIVIVFLLIVFVVSMKRGEEDSDKYSGDTESDTLFNVVAAAAAAQQQRIERGEISIPTCERSVSYKIVQPPLPLKTSTLCIAPPTLEAPNNHTVYDIPCKTSPTSNSSVCSIFSGSESHQHYHHHHKYYSRVLSSAQPYETPLVTPRSSRQNLFTSTSTLNTITGSEVLVSRSTPLPPQPASTGTMTLDRVKRVKLKKPLPVVKPAVLLSAAKHTANHPVPPERDSREMLAMSERQPKPRAPTPESKVDNTASTHDEGYCTAKHPVRLLQPAGVDSIANTQDMYCSPPEDEQEIMETLEKMNVLNIPRQDIQVLSHIGNGEFGSVAKAYWKRKLGETEVAVKSVPLSEHSDNSEERVKLLQEAVMMGQFRHPNVVQLHGIATAGTSFMLVLGYLAKGDLRTHLLQMNRKSLLSSTNKLLTSYSQQVALGMHYLASKGFVHRDLAARNIFVSESNTCKVGDFGMSRDLANAPYYISRGGKIPVRWTAPEAMYYHKYSSASDVWSYGCVLYEIWSLGRLPFRKFTNAQVLERLDSGYRLPPPPGTPRAIYELMIKAWHLNPRRRPEFKNVLVQLVQDEACLLHIPVGDASTSQQASQLGSPLAAGEYMYSDLQRSYLQKQSSPQEEEQYDSLIGRKYVLSFPTSSADIDYLYNDRSMPPRRSQLVSNSDTDSSEEYEET